MAAPVNGIYLPAVVVSQTAFDPFGVVLRGAGQVNGYQNRFEYQYKEKESTFGLNRISLGARTVNPTTGRMDGIDPLAEKMPSWSSYIYVFDNPIKYIDYNGLIPIPVKKLFKGMAHRLDSWFGPINTGLSYASKFHKGLDINFGGGRADYGAPVLGTHDGTVSIKDNLNGNEGSMVTVTSPDKNLEHATYI